MKIIKGIGKGLARMFPGQTIVGLVALFAGIHFQNRVLVSAGNEIIRNNPAAPIQVLVPEAMATPIQINVPVPSVSVSNFPEKETTPGKFIGSIPPVDLPTQEPEATAKKRRVRRGLFGRILGERKKEPPSLFPTEGDRRTIFKR